MWRGHVTVNSDAIKSRLGNILLSEFQIDFTGIDPDISVFDALAIDSITLVGIATRVEREFDIEIPLSLIENPTINNFIASISNELIKKQSNSKKYSWQR